MSIIKQFRHFCRRFCVWGYDTYITIQIDPSRPIIGATEQKFRKFNTEMCALLAKENMDFDDIRKSVANILKEE